MNKNELHEKLRQDFTKERGFGVTKVDDEEWKNIYFVVPPPPPTDLKGIKLSFNLLGDALKVLGALPQFSDMTELDRLVNFLFVRREVVQSSRLEGTWSTIDHALTPGQIIDENEGKSEHQAVRSYASLLEDIISKTAAQRETVFTKEFICEIQRRIVENDPRSKGVPGKLRTEGEPGSIVAIGRSQRKENTTYNPTPPSEVERCLAEVLDWFGDEELAQMGDAGMGLSLPIRLAIGHSHFEAVHPFTDGNGRTGRALWPLQMVCSGNMPLYLSGYVEEFKDEYGHALQEAQKKLNYIPIIEFICNAIIESDIEARKTKKSIIKLREDWLERGRFRQGSGPKRALDTLLTNPIVTASYLQDVLKISQTASIDTINALVKKKIIRFRRTERRHKVYAAEELIQILSRPFGSEIGLALEKAQELLNL